MQHTKFGRTGMSVSRLCLGTATFGKQTDEAESHRILDAAADAGINFLDTADFYPMGAAHAQLGSTEEITGRWLKGKRHRFIVASKAGAPMSPLPWDQGGSRKHLLDAIDASLRRLGTDYVDLYQLHWDAPTTPLDETLEAFDTIVRSGKARYIGISNILAYRLARSLGRSDVLRAARYVSVQPRYNLLFREIERELLPLAHEEGLAVIPFNPLAGGLLTGKYSLDKAPDKGRFSQEVGKFGEVYQERYWDAAPISRPEGGSRERSRLWKVGVVFAIALGFIMAMLDVTVVNVALADVQREFSSPLSKLVWIVDAYALTFASLLLLGGSLADWIGAKRAYISGLAIFVFASALCVFATSTAFLIIARLLQGIGAAFFLPSSLTLLTRSFPDAAIFMPLSRSRKQVLAYPVFQKTRAPFSIVVL
jgi:1-deoxyxylulose-5-phosphate synthase